MGKSRDVIVRWQVEDGYVGKSRPQKTVIDRQDWDDTPEDERERLIEEYVQEDFQNTITWALDGDVEVPDSVAPSGEGEETNDA